jgi:hypothetical protein
MQKDRYAEIDRIMFVPVKGVIALQGADMAAYHTYLFGRAWLKDGEAAMADPHFRDFVRRGYSGLIMMREHIEELIGRIRETRP